MQNSIKNVIAIILIAVSMLSAKEITEADIQGWNQVEVGKYTTITDDMRSDISQTLLDTLMDLEAVKIANMIRVGNYFVVSYISSRDFEFNVAIKKKEESRLTEGQKRKELESIAGMVKSVKLTITDKDIPRFIADIYPNAKPIKLELHGHAYFETHVVYGVNHDQLRSRKTVEFNGQTMPPIRPVEHYGIVVNSFGAKVDHSDFAEYLDANNSYNQKRGPIEKINRLVNMYVVKEKDEAFVDNFIVTDPGLTGSPQVIYIFFGEVYKELAEGKKQPVYKKNESLQSQKTQLAKDVIELQSHLNALEQDVRGLTKEIADLNKGKQDQIALMKTASELVDILAESMRKPMSSELKESIKRRFQKIADDMKKK